MADPDRAVAPSRVLTWERCLNVRDLGGLPTRDGGRTRWRALVRADSLCRLTPAGQEALHRHGVRTLIDLRTPREIAAEPGPFGAAATDDDLRYLHLPIPAAAVVEAPTPSQGYCLALDGAREAISRLAAAVAHAPPGGVLFHCHAGKDRTGLVAAVLLALVGVPDEAIVEDYVLLGDFEALAREWVRWIVGHTQDPVERARLLRGAPPDPDVMRALLHHLHGQHGGAEAYLLGGGATAADVALLRARLREPAA
jgi:protein-tyrosine phosphatase